MVFAKENLLGNSYDWNPESDSADKTLHAPTRKRFDRFNGDNVLYMINLFHRFTAKISLAEGQRIEALIAKELPLSHSSEISVLNWLGQNLQKIKPDENPGK